MGATRTDSASIVASIGGLVIAAIGILSEPLIVASQRPETQDTDGRDKPNSEKDNVNARLWDDPFAPFSDSENPASIVPSVRNAENTLVLVVPVNTQLYEEDRENRLRVRYAVQRALLDRGYAPTQASILRRLTLHLPAQDVQPPILITKATQSTEDNRDQFLPSTLLQKQPTQQSTTSSSGISKYVTAPAQFFELQPMAHPLSRKAGTSQFLNVVVVWLPDSVLWTDSYRRGIFNEIDSQLREGCGSTSSQSDCTNQSGPT